MATAQAAVRKLCNGCDTEDALWFCVDCSEKLCDNCKNVHQRLAKTKNDTIISISEVQGGINRKSVPVLCEKHKTKLCELYCCTCDKLICAQCSISSNHKHHSFTSIETLIDSKISELDNIEQIFKSKLVSYNTVLASDDKQHADYMLHLDQLKEEVKGQADKIVKELYKLRDSQLSELSVLQREEETRSKTKHEEYQSCLMNMRKTIKSVQEAKVSGDAVVMIEVIKTSTKSYQSLEDPTASTLPCPKFERDENPEIPLLLQLQGHLNLPVIKIENAEFEDPKVMHTPQSEAGHVLPKRVIDMNKVNLKLRIKIKGKKGLVKSIIPTENDMAWIVVDPDKHLSLIDSNGNVVKNSVKVAREIWCAVLYDGDILVLQEKSRNVMRFSNNGDFVAIFSDFSPFYTADLCITSQQNVMVCLVSSLTLDTTGASKVVRLDREGHVIQEIQYYNQVPLFTAANSVICLSSGDVVVRDHVKDVDFIVTCVDGKGNFKYSWKGEIQGKKVPKFWLSQMTHDDQNIYITNRKNSCVYVLGENREAEEFMLDKYGITGPVAISIDNRGRMWIGCVANIYILG